MLTLQKAEGIDFRLLHQAADRLTPKLRRTLLAAFENLPEAALQPLIAALEAGRIDEVMGLLQSVVDPAAQAQISGVLAEAFSGAANLQGAEFNLRFDIKNPQAVRWAEANAAKLVTSVDNQTRSALRDIVVRGIQDGIPPASQAREIRQLIGLSRRDATAADNFFRGLMAEANTEKQQALALSRFESYQRRLLRQRAETIARTETIRAANMGQRAAWDAAADGGLIDRASTRIVWIATSDSRTCPICSVLDGQTIGFEESFQVREQATGFSRDGDDFVIEGTKPVSGGPRSERTPPSHPRCRCSVGLVEGSASESAGESVAGQARGATLSDATRDPKSAFTRFEGDRGVPTAPQLKIEQQNRLSARLREDMTELDVMRAKRHMFPNGSVPDRLLGSVADPYDDLSRSIVSQWAETAGDTDPTSLTIQRAAAEKFGLQWPPRGYKIPKETMQAVDKLWDADGVAQALSSSLDEMGDETRRVLDVMFPDSDSVVLFRGLDAPLPTGQNVAYSTNPLSSFSSDPLTAEFFGARRGGIEASVNPRIMATVVPKDRIVSTPFSGFGSLSEQEFVVAGSRTDDLATVFDLDLQEDEWRDFMFGGGL